MRSHHGSYIDRAMCAVHGVTFSTVHNITVLRLLIVNDSTDTSDSVSRTHNVKRAIGLLDSIVLENASSLRSFSADEG